MWFLKPIPTPSTFPDVSGLISEVSLYSPYSTASLPKYPTAHSLASGELEGGGLGLLGERQPRLAPIYEWFLF